MSELADARQNKKTQIENAAVWVASPPVLARMQKHLSAEPMIAVDTESDSLYSYFEKVCLLQFSTREADYVVDPLAFASLLDDGIASLGPIFADPRIEKVFHAAEYDILCLKRDYNFEFENLFDTMIAARILGWKSFGLGSILHERFEVTLNKKMQRADWGQRPLTQEQIAYAREDTHYLLRLRDLQVAELEKAGRLEEAREQFARLACLQPTPRKFDLDAYWNIDGARGLDPLALGVLRELFRFRDAQARKDDRPPFKVMPDSVLMRIAEARPTSPRALGQLSGVPEVVTRRHGTSIISAVARGTASPQTTTPQPRARNEAFLDNHARDRMGKLKEWRKARAAQRGVETDVIVSNDTLYAIARKNPKTLDTLIEVTGLGPWKAREYGEELLAVVLGKKK
jgi:ribonuclease D